MCAPPPPQHVSTSPTPASEHLPTPACELLRHPSMLAPPPTQPVSPFLTTACEHLPAPTHELPPFPSLSVALSGSQKQPFQPIKRVQCC